MRKPSSFWQFTHLLRSMRRPIRSKQPSARRLSCEHLEARHLLAADGWYNIDLPADVNADGVVTPIDALLVANVVYENSGSSVTLTADNPGSIYPDVNNDGQIGEADFTQIANQVGGGSGSDAGPGNALQASEATASVASAGMGAAEAMMSMSTSASGGGEATPASSLAYFSVDVDTPTARESDGSFDFTITLQGAAPGGATIYYTVGSGTATASSAAGGNVNTPYSQPTDFIGKQGAVTLSVDGETAIVNVAILDDVWVEQNETVQLTIDSVTDPPMSTDGISYLYDANSSTFLALGTIVDDDTAFATLAPHQNAGAKEGTVADHWNRTFKAQLSNPVDAEVTVGLTVAPGTATGADYSVPANQVIKFGVGDTVSNLFQVNITNDLIIELNEDYSVTLSSISPAGRDARLDTDPSNLSVTDTIVNDDSGTINIVPSWVATDAETTADALEAEWGAKYFRLILRHDEFPTLDGVAIDIAVAVNWRTVDGTAIEGGGGAGSQDYTGGTGVVSGGTYAFGSLPVSVNDDNVAEPDQSFAVELFGALNWGGPTIPPRAVSLGASSVTATIRGDDYATINIGDAATVEGDAGDLTDISFAVTLSGLIDRAVTVSTNAVPGNGAGGPQATEGTGADFIVLPGYSSVTLSPGSFAGSNQVVKVRVYGDNTEEPTEYFRIFLGVLSDNGLAPFISISDDDGLGTIINDD